MKRVGNLFEQCFSEDNLYMAYLDARKGKRAKKSVIEFEKSLGSNIEYLRQSISDGSYAPKPYAKFIIHEPKERVIYAPHFSDVVVQHAIYRVIYPIFDATFIRQSHGCRKNHGTHSASAYAQWALQQCDDEDYLIQLDIRKFFYSIDRTILGTLIENKIKDVRLVSMMKLFMSMEDSPVGIPIGNLLSQLYALIYLSPLDHFIKRDIGQRLYVRYVDDFILFGVSLEEAQVLKTIIIDFLNKRLHLTLSKCTIQKIKRGTNFVGFRTFKGLKLVRKRSMYNFRKAVKNNNTEALASMMGHAKGTQTMRYYTSILEKHNANS